VTILTLHNSTFDNHAVGSSVAPIGYCAATSRLSAKRHFRKGGKAGPTSRTHWRFRIPQNTHSAVHGPIILRVNGEVPNVA
jgi:hypothetical protein